MYFERWKSMDCKDKKIYCIFQNSNKTTILYNKNHLSTLVIKSE